MNRDAKPLVNPAYTPIEISENEVHFRVGPFKGAKHTIADNDGEGIISDLVERFDGTRSVVEIAAEFDEPEQVRAAVEFLFDKNVIIDARDDGTDELRNYSLIAPNASADQVEQVRTSSVGIIARGRIGAMVASDLAEIGLKEISIKDVGSDPSKMGAPDSKRVRRYGGDIESLVEDVDHVIYATESADFETAMEVNAVAVDHGTPFTAAHLLGMEGIIGPTVLPGKTPCYNCLLGHWTAGAVSSADEEAVQYFTEYLQGPHGDGFHLPSHRHLTVGVLTKELATQLLTGHGYLAGRTFDIDFLTMEFETNELFKHPRCDVCGVRHDDYDRIVGTDVIDDG